jgi:hypothetical protein
MSKSVAIIIGIVLVAMLAGLALVSFGGLAAYNFAFRGESGSGNVITETREVADFDEVSVCCGMHLLLEQGDSESVRLEGDDNILDKIKTSVKGDTLVIEYETGLKNIRPTKRVRAYVVMPVVRGVKTSGGSKLTASELIADDFELSVSGGGSADIDYLEADTLTLDASGGGSVNIASGEVDDQSVKVSGGGDYSAADLKSQTAELDAEGGGNATIWVVDELDVSASGGSKVQIYGTPRITQNTSGGSSIQSMGER